MRKISKEAAEAFMKTKNYKKDNTEVYINEHSAGGTITQMFLFGNLIAEHSDTGLYITNAGFFTNTTKERLTALPGVSICQKNRAWYLNGQQWDGKRIRIN